MENKPIQHKQENAGKIGLDVNVEMVLRDKDGNIKPIFQDNRLTLWLIKKGWLSPLWINSWGRHFSFLFGSWQLSKVNANIITDTGRAAVAGLINGNGGIATFASIGQGTGAVAAAITDTTLGTEVTASGTGASGVHAVAAATASRVTTTVTNDTAQLVGTVSELATIAVTESGIFNATTNGIMLARQVFTAVNVVNGDSLQFTWKVKAA